MMLAIRVDGGRSALQLLLVAVHCGVGSFQRFGDVFSRSPRRHANCGSDGNPMSVLSAAKGILAEHAIPDAASPQLGFFRTAVQDDDEFVPSPPPHEIS
jgi:hypothetical protein